jgi:glycosyltransferase involved in cell wall biosynthesis
MRILNLIQRFPPVIGGAEAWCEGVTRYLANRGHSVEVLSLRVVDEAGLWGDIMPPSHVAVGPVDLYPGIRVRRCRPSDTAWGFVRLLEIAGAQVSGRYSAELFGRVAAAVRRADVVHLHHHFVPLSFWGLAIARLNRRPVVVTPHLHPGDPTNEQPLAWWLLRKCDAVIAVTPHEAELYVRGGVRCDRAVVSSNAVDADRFESGRRIGLREEVRSRWGLSGETRVVTFLGRKQERKDISVLIQAARRLGETMDLAVVLVGPQSDWYREAIETWDCKAFRLIDVPVIPEETKVAVLAASDVVVQPSWEEAFGIVFLEAWASGLPVIGAHWGAIPQVIRDAGLTFARGDAANLAERLDWLFTHPEEACAMAQRGRLRVARDHTWERVGFAVEQAYAVALRARGRNDPWLAGISPPASLRQPERGEKNGVRPPVS